MSQIIPTGGEYSVGFGNSRLSTTGGGTFVNPAYRTGLQFSFAQPLMRDFGVDITRRGITIARNNLGVTEGFFRTAMMNTVSAVEQAYLDLIYARRAVDVTKESLFLARDQARITQIRIDVGASAPLDILQPRVTIATTEEELIRRVAAVRNAEDNLRALLNLPPSEWDRPIVPSDDVTYEKTIPIDLDRAVQHASTWLTRIARELGCDDRDHALAALRRTLHAVRDRMPAAEAAGVERPRPYDLRHSFVSLVSEHVNNLVKVADLAGHADTRTTEGYRHAVRPSLPHAIDAWNRFLNRPPKLPSEQTPSSRRS